MKQEEVIWIESVKAGKTQHFKMLYQKHHRRLFQICLQFTKNHSDAEEQLQEIFLRLLEKIHLFKGDASFSTWSHRLAVNHLLNFYRKNEKQTDELPEALEAKPERDSDLAIILKKGIGQLPQGFRQVLVLHDQEGFSHDEIAEMLDISPSTSRSQLCRARLALREILKPNLSKEVCS